MRGWRLSWFFPVSKALAFLALPSHIMLWLFAGAVLALLAGWNRTARGLGIAALALLVLLGVVPSVAVFALALVVVLRRATAEPSAAGPAGGRAVRS